jgi:transposase
MPAPVSQDLRQRVVTAYEDGEGSFRELGLRFGVGEASVNRWVALKRKTGDLRPKPRGGSQPKLTEDQRLVLRQWVEAECDLTLAQLADRLRTQCDVVLSISAVSRTLLRMGFTLKKKPSASRRGTRSG